ncbi:alpha/beta-hydrolase [Lojkania enalia]|uniref:Alpha/beta-hydrolase n=1 Tax=Lojkania enalia TaxID=147567 RepID=A0A9P4N4P4_9PLEO|nr:alpha/beta-hydrolase [Didymosphaeria enalia]
MYSKRFGLFNLGIVASVLRASFGYPQNRSISWTDCPEDIGVPAACANFTVPLDYTDIDSGKTLNLSLLKAKATKEPFKGSILINPGGPGIAAVPFLESLAAVLLVMTGGHFDVIAFDPRGTGNTLPIDCYPTSPIERLYQQLASPPTTNASDVALGTTWSIQKTYTQSCYETNKDVGKLVGSGFVARDVMQIVDALGEDGMLRYWGQSYGTFLGETVAALFPDRIDKMVIDGVINPHEYVDAWEYDPIPVGDLVLDQFLNSCVIAGKDACALAGEGATVQSLTAKIHDLIETTKFEPIVLGSNITTDVIRSSDITATMGSALRVAIAYAPSLAGYLNAIFERNATAYYENRAVLVPELEAALGGTGPDGLQAIRCSDAIFRTDDLGTIKLRAESLLNLSSVFGDTYTSSYITCSLWKMHAKGRYKGDYKVKTKNPVLLIGSPFDLRTPLVSAHNVSTGFERSVVLQHNGLGHCVLYSPGQCAIKAVQDYFTNGTLPEPGTICEQDFDVFSGKV